MFFVVWASVAWAHGAKRAYFDLMLNGAEVELQLTVEEDDLRVVLEKEGVILANTPIKTLQNKVPAYLEKYFELSLNERKTKPRLKTIKFGNRHFKVLYSLGARPKKIRSLKLHSDYMNKHFKEHLNVFRFDWKEEKKLYQLHAGRQTVEHSFE